MSLKWLHIKGCLKILLSYLAGVFTAAVVDYVFVYLKGGQEHPCVYFDRVLGIYYRPGFLWTVCGLAVIAFFLLCLAFLRRSWAISFFSAFVVGIAHVGYQLHLSPYPTC
jgi:hypothetical protein